MLTSNPEDYRLRFKTHEQRLNSKKQEKLVQQQLLAGLVQRHLSLVWLNRVHYRLLENRGVIWLSLHLMKNTLSFWRSESFHSRGLLNTLALFMVILLHVCPLQQPIQLAHPSNPALVDNCLVLVLLWAVHFLVVLQVLIYLLNQ